MIELHCETDLRLEIFPAPTQLGDRTWMIGGRRIEAHGIRSVTARTIRLPSGTGRLRFA
jgi:hypothetical protein